VVSDRQPSIYGGATGDDDDVAASRSDVDFFYDDSRMSRMSLIVRHLGLVVGSGACALAVCVVVVVTAIACRYRAASTAAASVAHKGYRLAATDDKPAGAPANDGGRTENGYKHGGGGGGGRRWVDGPRGDATAARASLIRCDGDGDAFVTSSITMTSSSSRRGHVTEWFV